MTRTIAKRRQKYQVKSAGAPNWVIIGIVAAFVVVAALVVVNIFFATPPPPVAINASRVLGPDNAPVTIEEYGDFQ